MHSVRPDLPIVGSKDYLYLTCLKPIEIDSKGCKVEVGYRPNAGYREEDGEQGPDPEPNSRVESCLCTSKVD